MTTIPRSSTRFPRRTDAVGPRPARTVDADLTGVDRALRPPADSRAAATAEPRDDCRDRPRRRTPVRRRPGATERSADVGPCSQDFHRTTAQRVRRGRVDRGELDRVSFSVKRSKPDHCNRATLCVSAVFAVPGVRLSVTLVHCIHTAENI